MALCRIKTCEQLRGQAPGEFGKLPGLDRIPEMRCLRKKMEQLSTGDHAEKWASHLSSYWMQQEPEAVGTLYIDGHVRFYHGELTKLPRRFVSRQQLCLRGVTLTEADILPDRENKQLIIRVHNSSRAATNKYLAQLFEHLNQAQIDYPGTDLRLVYQLSWISDG